MLTYVTIIKVKLEGKHIGDIKEVASGGYAYFPKGSKTCGDVYSTVAAVKSTL